MVAREDKFGGSSAPESLTPVQADILSAIVSASESLDKIAHMLQNLVEIERAQENRLRQIGGVLLEIRTSLSMVGTPPMPGFLDSLAIALVQHMGRR